MDSLEVLAAKTATVDKGDIQIISGGLKAYSSYFKFLTGYSISGQKHISNEIVVKEARLGRDLTEKEEHVIIKKYQDYMILEKDNK